MKTKFFILLAVAFSPYFAYSAPHPDRFGNPREALWQSSRTAASGWMVISTGNVILRSIDVQVAVSGSSMTVYNSTSPNAWSTTVDTVTIINTANERQHFFDNKLSSGIAFEKRGGAEILVNWEYLDTTNLPTRSR